MNRKRFYIFTSAYTLLCAVSVFASHISYKLIIASKSAIHKNHYCLNHSAKELAIEFLANATITLVYFFLLVMCYLITLISLRNTQIKNENIAEKSEANSMLRVSLLLTLLTVILVFITTHITFWSIALVPLLLLPILSFAVYIQPLYKSNNYPENKQQQPK